MSTLYLIPAPLAPVPVTQVLLPGDRDIVRQLCHFVVEELRTGRRYVSALGASPQELHFEELNEHTPPEQVEALLAPMHRGFDMGLISEAGLPAVADPGALLVAAAHRHHFTVVPMVGPSSLMMALMASGLNGQCFAFCGYIPVKQPERNRRIRELEHRSAVEHQTQIMIETPYRNAALMEQLVQQCQPHTRLTVAVDLTGPSMYVKTRTAAEWKRDMPDFQERFHKKPCVFLLLA